MTSTPERVTLDMAEDAVSNLLLQQKIDGAYCFPQTCHH